MREIGNLSSEELANRFVSYLKTLSIPASADAEQGAWIIWVQNDDDREKSKLELDQFRESPDAAQYVNAVAEAKKLQQAQAREQKAVLKRQIDIRKRWSGVWWASHPATQILTAICIVIVIAGTDWQARQTGWMGLPATCNAEDSVIRNAMFIQPPMVLAMEGQEVALFPRASLAETLKTGQVWRLVTPVFLHFGVLHIVFNMMWLRQLGRAVEFAKGTRRFLLLFLILAVSSNLVQYWWNGPAFGGMSGVVFGLIGYVWMKGRTQPQDGLGLMPDQIVYSFLWLFLCMGGMMGPIANGAHLGGFIVGILIGARRAIIRRILGQ